MSEKNMQKTIKGFLKQVREKLPEWLKEKKEDKEILSELEEHIWDKAEELSGTGTATDNSVRMAIATMGTPKDIGREYKKRGTPKVYITEELWPYYTKGLLIVMALIIIGNIVAFIINLLTGDLDDLLNTFNIFTSLLAGFAIVTMIFVGLSMEGYLPEDFKSRKTLEREKKELQKAREKGWPISEKTGKPLKPFIKPADKIIGGIFSLVIGGFFMLLPSIESLSNITSQINPQFLFLMQVAGIMILIDGGMTLIRGILGKKNITAHQVVIVLTIVLKSAGIIWWIVMINLPEIIPIIYMENLESTINVVAIPAEYHIHIKQLLTVIIVITFLTCAGDVYNLIKLEKYRK